MRCTSGAPSANLAVKPHRVLGFRGQCDVALSLFSFFFVWVYGGELRAEGLEVGRDPNLNPKALNATTPSGRYPEPSTTKTWLHSEN